MADIRREGLFELNGGQVVAYLGHSSYVKIPDGVSVLGKESFSDNKFIEVLHLPKSVVSVRQACFHNCTNLKKVIVGGKNIHFAKGCFKGCANLREIVTAKQYPTRIGDLTVNGYITINLKENNVSTAPTVTITDKMRDTIFDLVSTYYQGEYENTVNEKLEIFIDDSLVQHPASINFWETHRQEWNDTLRLQRLSYEKLIYRQKNEFIQQLQVGGLDEAYDCLDEQAIRYKELLKSQKAERVSFLEDFKQAQDTFNKNLLGMGYVSWSHGFEENIFE